MENAQRVGAVVKSGNRPNDHEDAEIRGEKGHVRISREEDTLEFQGIKLFFLTLDLVTCLKPFSTATCVHPSLCLVFTAPASPHEKPL